MPPKVSVIIPIFNGSRHGLKYCLESVIQQDYKNMEFILIDDSSTDDSLDVIMSEMHTSQKHCKVIHHEINDGLSKTLNEGVAESSGKYILILQQDCSLISRTSVKDSIDFIESFGCSVLVGVPEVNWKCLNTFQRVFKIRINESEVDNKQSNRVLVTQLKCDLFKKEVFSLVGGFDFIHRSVGQDFVMSSKLYENSIQMFTYSKFVYRIRYEGENTFESLCKKEFRYALAVPYVARAWFRSGLLLTTDSGQSKKKKHGRFFNLLFPTVLVLFTAAYFVTGNTLAITFVTILFLVWVFRTLKIIKILKTYGLTSHQVVVSVLTFITLDLIYSVGFYVGTIYLLKNQKIPSH